MGRWKKWGLIAVVAFLCVYFVAHYGPPLLNDFQTDGTLRLTGLEAPVKVVRDEKGMAYIYARGLNDAIKAQGFVAAQDRLFQMNLTRLFASGRISELIGAGGIPSDTRMRTLGFRRNARKHARILSPQTRDFLQAYADGVNAYIESRGSTHHLEFKLAGLTPDRWTITDSLTIMYYMGWDSAGNLQAEIISQLLVDKVGPERARTLFPLLRNPDEPGMMARVADPGRRPRLGAALDARLLAHLARGQLRVGSNNWTVAARFSASGKPIVANDPHLDSRVLPGPWHPYGIITPGLRAVGVIIPGIPGMAVGRNADVAFGVTNAYGDAQDLFIESLDPKDANRYLEGQQSYPFEVVEEVIRVRDKEAPEGFRLQKIKIRFTHRGPVVSGVLKGLENGGGGKRVISMRWSAYEIMGPEIGLLSLLKARSVEEISHAVGRVSAIMLNFVFADKTGNVGWQVSSRIPIRRHGDGALPQLVTDGNDYWTGFVAPEQMPQRINPDRGWLGTCNHLTVGADYPYYYSSRVSSSYRYERLHELLADPGKTTPADHLRFQTDTVNPMARKLAPLLAQVLADDPQTKALSEILSAWDYKDDIDKTAPLVFQAIYHRFALRVFEDELGDDVVQLMLKSWTYWSERLQEMVLAGNSPWFDDVRTVDKNETLTDILRLAAQEAKADLEKRIGDDPQKWRWGKAHHITFVSPVRREGFGSGLMGGGTHEFPGSMETLCRAGFGFTKPFKVRLTAALRMVADLGDEDKVLAVLPGGVTGRVFHPHTTDQIEPFVKGQALYWWFSDKAIADNTKATLDLTP